MRRVPPLANPSTDPALPYRDASSGNYPGSWPSAEFYNVVLAELCHLIEHAGLTLDANDLEQVRKAIDAKIAAASAGYGAAARDHRVVTAGPLTAPPGSPAEADQYLVAGSATGAFAGKDYQIASYSGASWSFSGTVIVGRVFRIAETDSYFERTVSGWSAYTPPVRSHAHPQAQVDNLVADLAAINAAIAGKVAKAGDTMTGLLRVSAGAGQAPAGGAQKGSIYVTGSDNAYGLQVGTVSADGRSWLQAGRTDAVTYYNITLNELGGNVAIGTTTPAAKLDVNGDTITRGVHKVTAAAGQPSVVVDAQASGSERPVVYLRKQGVDRLVISADGSSPGQVYYEAKGANGTHAFFTNNVQRFAVQPDGALWVPNGTGSGAHVLAGGVAPAWKILSGLGLAAYYNQYGTLTGGEGVHAAATSAGVARGCSVTIQSVSSNAQAVVTFSTPLPDANYAIVGVGALGVSSKTANGFVLSLGAMGSATATFSFAIVY